MSVEKALTSQTDTGPANHTVEFSFATAERDAGLGRRPGLYGVAPEEHTAAAGALAPAWTTRPIGVRIHVD